VAETGAPDGMIYHEGNVYLALLRKARSAVPHAKS